MRQPLLLCAAALGLLLQPASAGEVAGKVEMPEVCSPGVSPAVVMLDPLDGPAPASAPPEAAAEVALVDQRGLQFEPRVRAMSRGQTLRFVNSDAETHSVHAVTPGFDFNQSLSAGQTRDWVPDRPGVIRLACDVHSHMRGYVVVAAGPWVATCSRLGRFRLDGVPDGRYRLTVWHEMGEPLEREIEVRGGADVTVPTLTLKVAAPTLSRGAREPIRPWPEVIDRISVLLAASLDAATRPAEWKRARTLAEDAYWAEFEASDMETAVRTHLGFARKGAIESRFSAVIAMVPEVAQNRQPPSAMAELTRQLILDLFHVSNELVQKGVTDRSRIFATTGAAAVAEPASVGTQGTERLDELQKRFAAVRKLADAGQADDASSAMSQIYFITFEPIETFISARKPQDVRALELQYNAIRGRIGTGLKGDALATQLDAFMAEVAATLARSKSQPVGTFGPAFAASFVTILREGAEVILLLAMLVSLVSKTGQPGALRAIRTGVILAVVASGLTAWGLSLLVASAQSRARELVEGLVMLTAAGVLFYVSYWLISKSESRRWTEFLKRQARRGAEAGGFVSLALTAFVAVYREGAETALLYQAMIGAQGGARSGLTGLAAGLAAGLIVLAALAILIRKTSVRLPLRTFAQAPRALLFTLAVVFSGNGIAELQASGVVKNTPLASLSWLGNGIPALGLYPTVQTLSVQGVLLVGAVLALIVLLTGEQDTRPVAAESKVGSPPAGVGV